MKKRPLPPLFDTTDEGRRVYEFRATINKREIREIHIDPHYEQEHGSYMTDEIIYNFAWELAKEES